MHNVALDAMGRWHTAIHDRAPPSKGAFKPVLKYVLRIDIRTDIVIGRAEDRGDFSNNSIIEMRMVLSISISTRGRQESH